MSAPSITPAESAVPSPVALRPRTRTSRAFTWLGTLMILAGLSAFATIGYQILWTHHTYTVHQDQLQKTLSAQWQVPVDVKPTDVLPTPLPSASPSASAPASSSPTVKPAPLPVDKLNRTHLAPNLVLSIPRMQATYIAVYGTDASALSRGPGIYPTSPDPGQVGNFAIAGHRTTHGAPFYHLDRLKTGDQIILITKHHRYVYKVYASETVLPSQVEVAAPMPDHPGVVPHDSYLTLSACTPFYSASHRLIVHAVLDKSLSN